MSNNQVLPGHLTRERLKTVTDEALVNEYLAGESRAFEEIVCRYRPRLLNFVARLTDDRDKAEDLVQEAFLRIARHIASFDPSKKFSTWSYTIAANLAKNELRNRSRDPVMLFQRIQQNWDNDDQPLEFEDSSSRPDRMYETRHLRELVEGSVDMLPEHHREVFVLREFEGKSYEEIADITSLDLGTVKSRLNRARSRFAGIMTPLLNDHPPKDQMPKKNSGKQARRNAKGTGIKSPPQVQKEAEQEESKVRDRLRDYLRLNPRALEGPTYEHLCPDVPRNKFRILFEEAKRLNKQESKTNGTTPKVAESTETAHSNGETPVAVLQSPGKRKRGRLFATQELAIKEGILTLLRDDPSIDGDQAYERLNPPLRKPPFMKRFLLISAEMRNGQSEIPTLPVTPTVAAKQPASAKPSDARIATEDVKETVLSFRFENGSVTAHQNDDGSWNFEMKSSKVSPAHLAELLAAASKIAVKA